MIAYHNSKIGLYIEIKFKLNFPLYHADPIILWFLLKSLSMIPIDLQRGYTKDRELLRSISFNDSITSMTMEAKVTFYSLVSTTAY